MAFSFEGYHGNTAVVGAQWGDEGKGKVTDLLAPLHDMGGKGIGSNNAGHTFRRNGVEVNAHQLPCTVNEAGKLNILGPGVFLNSVALVKEISEVQTAGIEIDQSNLIIDGRAHLTTPRHTRLDELREGSSSGQGSTKTGVAFVAADKGLREGIRAEMLVDSSRKEIIQIAYDGLSRLALVRGAGGIEAPRRPLSIKEANEKAEEFADAIEALKPYITDGVAILHDRLSQGQTILIEGSQAFGLDINYGKYPFVTSSDTTVTGLLSGLGMNYKQLDRAIGVIKAVPSKVGGGPFVTRETDPEIEERLRGKRGTIDGEYGKTSQRPREMGYLDLVNIRDATQVNGFDEFLLTKTDWLSKCHEGIKVATSYLLDDVEIYSVPLNAEELARCEPLYEVFPPVAASDVEGVKDYDKLPKSVHGVIDLIEKATDTPVTMFGTGPGREDIIFRQ